MANIIWKNLRKLCLPTTLSISHPLPSQEDQSHPLPSSTVPTTAASIMIKNFNPIHDISPSSISKPLSTPSTNSFSSSDSDSDTESPPDFATVFASQRFFFSCPGRSNSIIESRTDTLPASPPHAPLRGSVAVDKYSPDPYDDFKNSMQEMIEAREIRDVRADWDYLHELLSCYLTLNPKDTHRFIISAFADVIICLLSPPSSESATHRKV